MPRALPVLERSGHPATPQEMRNRFQEAQQRQGDLLRVAQDGRLEAGEQNAWWMACW